MFLDVEAPIGPSRRSISNFDNSVGRCIYCIGRAQHSHNRENDIGGGVSRDASWGFIRGGRMSPEKDTHGKADRAEFEADLVRKDQAYVCKFQGLDINSFEGLGTIMMKIV